MFDVAIMTLLLRHFHIKTEPSGGYDVLPPDLDQTPAADLARIKFYRNLIAHSKDGTIDEECYTEAWRHLYSVSEVFFHYCSIRCYYLPNKYVTCMIND